MRGAVVTGRGGDSCCIRSQIPPNGDSERWADVSKTAVSARRLSSSAHETKRPVTFTTADSTGAQIVGDVGGVPLSPVGKVDRLLKMGSFDMQGHRRYSRIGWQTTDRRVPYLPTRGCD